MTFDPGTFVAIGANLWSRRHGPPLAGCRAAVRALADAGVTVCCCSRWYRSRPVPPSHQPPYINGVVRVATSLSPAHLLRLLHDIEATFERRRGGRNAARTLDLDLLAYGRLCLTGQGGVVVPHPRLHRRAFVLRPLHDVAPGWRHPRLGTPLAALLRALPPDQAAEPIAQSGLACQRAATDL